MVAMGIRTLSKVISYPLAVALGIVVGYKSGVPLLGALAATAAVYNTWVMLS